MTFAERLKGYREKAGLSQTEVAARLNVPLSTYHSYEKKGTLPNVDMLLRMSYSLGCTVNDLAGYVPPEHNVQWAADYLAKYGIQLEYDHLTTEDNPSVTVSIIGLPDGGIFTMDSNLNDVKAIIKTSENEATAIVGEDWADYVKSGLRDHLIIEPLVRQALKKDSVSTGKTAEIRRDTFYEFFSDLLVRIEKNHGEGKDGKER